MRKTSKKGFTIVELVIVIAIIAILAAILIPTFANVISDARDSAAVSGAKGAYTEYVTKAETLEGEIATDFIFDGGEKRFVVYKAGKALTDANGKVEFFDSLEDAEKAFVFTPDDEATPDVDETVYGVATEVDGIDKFYTVAAP